MWRSCESVLLFCWTTFCPQQIHGCRGFSYLSVKSVTNENASLLTGVLRSRLEKKGKIILGRLRVNSWKRHALCYAVTAPVLWNGLPLPIRQDKGIDSLKILPNTYLFSKAFCLDFFKVYFWNTCIYCKYSFIKLLISYYYYYYYYNYYYYCNALLIIDVYRRRAP